MKIKVHILIFSLTFALLLPVALSAQVVPSEILIGGTVSLTGRFTTIGGPFQKFDNNWAALVNKRGGFFVKEFNKKLPIRYIHYDDKSDQATSQKFYEKLVTDDKVHILIGPFGSFLNFAASTVAEKYKVPMAMDNANDKKLFERGFTWSVSQLDYADRESHNYLEMLKKEGKVKTMAMFAEDTLHATGVLKAAVDKAKEYGINVVLNETLPAATKDFSALIIKIKGLNPDVVFCEGFPSFEIPFMKQAHEMGLQPKEFYCGHVTRPLLDALGTRANNIAGGALWVPGLKYPGKEDYLEVLKQTGIAWDEFQETGCRFTTHQSIQNAIETAGSLNPEKLMGALKKQKFVGIFGPIWHKADGSGYGAYVATQVQDSKVVSVYPPEVAESKHIFPTPWK